MPSSRSLRFLQITDTHLLGSRNGLLRGIPTFATLQAVQSHALSGFANPDGILLTGDLVQDDAEGYALIHEAFEHSPAPVYCLPGNHDLPEAMRQRLSDAPFVHADHAVIDGWLLIMLNTWKLHSAGGELGTAQLQRVTELLTQHSHLHTLICLHHHPIAMHSEWLDQVGLQDATEFHRRIAEHKQVRGVLWGHVHQALDRHIDGVHYMATPATCAQFLPNSHDFALDDKPPGYRTLTLNADGSIITQVIWLTQRQHIDA